MNDLHLTNIDVHSDYRGVVTAILNVPDQSVNVFNESALHDLDELLRAIEQDATVKALVFRSGKDSGFLAGADLRVIERLHGEDDAREMCFVGQQLLARLEALPIPTVAVIRGVCLGGGLEFVLACRHRIVVDDPRTKLGLPEVELGLMPGWGGTQRLPRLVGLSAALPMLLTGKKVGAHEAHRIGLADAISDAEHVDTHVLRLLALDEDHVPVEHFPSEGSSSIRRETISWFRRITDPRHPQSWWTKLKDRTRPGQWVVMKAARRGIAANAEHYPALPAILRAVQAGLKDRRVKVEPVVRSPFALPREATGEPGGPVGPALNGYCTERDEFAKLMLTQTHHSLLGLFFQREQARKTQTWTHGPTAKLPRIKRIGIIGAGVMGAGIAHWAASHGFEVVLKDVNTDLLDDGLSRIRDLFQESVRREAITETEAALKIGAIMTTIEWREFADVDLAIEAATERLDIKRAIFRDLELNCPPRALLASNTSALSIRAIGDGLMTPHRVFGLHFFNPVHRMALVEIVRGEQSRDEDVAMLVDFVKKLGKVPIVTSDSPGFVVNRILFPYLDEAVRLHCEGVSTEVIDRALKRFGMPMGPLELLDQVGLDIAAHVADTLSGLSPEPSPTTERLHDLVSNGLLGKKSGRGFYLYKGGRKLQAARSTAGLKRSLDPTVSAMGGLLMTGEAPPSQLLSKTWGAETSQDDVRDRIVLRLANEAAKCLQEGVVSEAWMVDLAMVLGTGFAPFTGGPLRMCELHGYGDIVAKLEYFQKTLGQRFAPAQWLIDQIEHSTEHTL